MRNMLLCASAIALVTACSPANEDTENTAAMVDADGIVDYQFDESYREHLRTLSSDEFEGRAPGTRGEELTIEYVANHFRELGVQSFTNENYTQPLPLVRIDQTRITDMAVQTESSEFTLQNRTD